MSDLPQILIPCDCGNKLYRSWGNICYDCKNYGMRVNPAYDQRNDLRYYIEHLIEYAVDQALRDHLESDHKGE